MSFMASYKRLEKLCGDVMGDERKVSAYIDAMLSKSLGSRYVAGWDSDLRNLKHYRWVRNQIVHDPDCCEEMMCGPEDVQWLEDFHDRIMDQTDPLALYRKATQQPSRPSAAPAYKSDPPVYSPRLGQPQLRRKPAGCALYLLVLIGILALIVI